MRPPAPTYFSDVPTDPAILENYIPLLNEGYYEIHGDALYRTAKRDDNVDIEPDFQDIISWTGVLNSFIVGDEYEAVDK